MAKRRRKKRTNPVTQPNRQTVENEPAVNEKPTAKKKIRHVYLDDLRPHPLQNVIISDVDDATFQVIRDSIARDGVLEPIEITTDNMVIAGHQRWRAAKELGHKKVKC